MSLSNHIIALSGPFETFETKIIGGTQVTNETKHPYYVLIAGSDTIRYSYCSGKKSYRLRIPFGKDK